MCSAGVIPSNLDSSEILLYLQADAYAGYDALCATCECPGSA